MKKKKKENNMKRDVETNKHNNIRTIPDVPSSIPEQIKNVISTTVTPSSGTAGCIWGGSFIVVLASIAISIFI